ncbi:unnamed protein product [Urochloa humidicola]
MPLSLRLASFTNRSCAASSHPVPPPECGHGASACSTTTDEVTAWSNAGGAPTRMDASPVLITTQHILSSLGIL